MISPTEKDIGRSVWYTWQPVDQKGEIVAVFPEIGQAHVLFEGGTSGVKRSCPFASLQWAGENTEVAPEVKDVDNR